VTDGCKAHLGLYIMCSRRLLPETAPGDPRPDIIHMLERGFTCTLRPCHAYLEFIIIIIHMLVTPRCTALYQLLM
jgi:hypothetical protein